MIHTEGSLLTIDADDRETRTEDIDGVLSSFVGGRGVGTKLAHDRIPFDADPFGPENRLFFTTGPMQTSNMSFTGRMNCTGISPLTGGLLSSNAGGFLSRHFGATGYGAVELTSKSDDLVAIHITDEEIEFEDVSELVGATTSEVGEYMADEHGLGDEQLLVAGPAGENRVRFASIMTTEHRAFGRGGLGAVMGSKNVKCISFDGDSAPDIDIDPIQMDVHREAATADDHPMNEAGTTSVTEYANHVSALPTHYFSELEFDGANEIGGGAVSDKKYKKGPVRSVPLPVSCRRRTRRLDWKPKDRSTRR